MFKANKVFSGISVNNLAVAKDFYTGILGLNIDHEDQGLTLNLPSSGKLFIYEKQDHVAAKYTVLNFEVTSIDESVTALTEMGIVFEIYDFGNGAKTEDSVIMRGIAVQRGPDIAWFKDPSGNILSVLQNA